MTLDKWKQEQIFILLAQRKTLQEIAKELGISVGAVWNYKTDNHRNKKREIPNKQVMPPQQEVDAKEPLSSVATRNIGPEYHHESNILKPEDYTMIQTLRALDLQNIQREQNKRITLELLAQDIEDLKQDTTRDRERKEEFDQKIAEVERKLTEKYRDEQDQATSNILEMRLNQLKQVLNKPSTIPQETQSHNENQKQSEEKAKVKIPITEPQSPPQEIQKNNPDTTPEGIAVREKPLVKPTDPQTSLSYELTKAGLDTKMDLDYGSIILVKSLIAFFRPILSPNNEITKQTEVSFGFFNGVFNQNKYDLIRFSLLNDKITKWFLNNDNLKAMLKGIPTLASILGYS